MQKALMALLTILCLIICITIGFFIGYWYVIKNQYVEECKHYDNCYHIIVDGNAYEYEFDMK